MLFVTNAPNHAPQFLTEFLLNLVALRGLVQVKLCDSKAKAAFDEISQNARSWRKSIATASIIFAHTNDE